MNTLEAIMTRTSIRKYTDQPVPEEEITTILKAGMRGPSAVNARDWAFLVIRDRKTLNSMADINGRPAEPLRGCAFAVLICGDRARSFAKAKDYWVVDGSIAAQNMILAAKELGIGSVWLGTWPQTERVEGLKAFFRLPEDIIPHSVIAFGYPAEKPAVKGPEWEADRVHYEQW